MNKGRRISQWAPWVAACTGITILTFAIPFILTLAAPNEMKWGLLSDISQTYGAVSIPLSGAALLGIAWSLILQARQLRIENADRSRSSLRELLLQSVEDPALLVCWEPPMYPMTREEYRRTAFLSAIYNGWRAEHANGMISDDILRYAAVRTMRGEAGRNHWKNTRAVWHTEASSSDRKFRRFVTIMDEALNIAEAEGPPVGLGDYFLPDQIRQEP
ncbi:DUF6082 family protein [Streptomyces sp. NPDC001914]|uniref:DUF6082 family protein n=1 Tax=Streptomyces sp. NPDC001914 TaxID=3364623 RepID=UPI003689E824